MFPVLALQLGMFLAISIACLALWNLIFLRISAGDDVVPYELRRPVPWDTRDLVAIFLMVIALLMLCAAPVVWYKQSATPEGGVVESVESEATLDATTNFGLIVATAAGTLSALGCACLWLRAHGANRHDLGFDLSHWRDDCARGVAGFAAASVPMFLVQLLLIQLIPPKHAVSDIFAADSSVLVLLVTAAVAVLVAPVTEEFFFRVLLQGWLEKLYAARAEYYARGGYFPEAAVRSEQPTQTALADLPAATSPAKEREPTGADSIEPAVLIPAPVGVASPTYMPVLISSFLFAVVHLGNGPSALPLFFFALVLGYLYRQTHRILPSIVAHMSLNAFSTIMLATGAG